MKTVKLPYPVTFQELLRLSVQTQAHQPNQEKATQASKGKTVLNKIILVALTITLACSENKEAPLAPILSLDRDVSLVQEDLAASGKIQSSLPAPTNLRYDTISDTSVIVRWNPVVEATDYDINYRKSEGGRWRNWPHREQPSSTAPSLGWNQHGIPMGCPG